MNIVDIIILAWLVMSAIRGYMVGFIRQILSFTGFVLGLLIGGWAIPFLLQSIQDASRPLIILVSTLIFAAILAGIGDGIGARLQVRLNIKVAQIANGILGVCCSILFILLSVWLLAGPLTRLPFANVSLMVERSVVIKTINQIMPQAPDLLGSINEAISSYGFPDVFVGPEPTVEPVGPASSPEVEAAATQAKGSTVRIEGFSCGSISVGSGFVAAPNYVATNAHVVAGMREPIVFNQDQRIPATVVLFDSNIDFAVLRTSVRLPGKPLPLTQEIQARDSTSAILGYPGGGPLKIIPGVIARSQTAVGRDIYGESVTSRQIYVLQADIQQGNSGGPVVMPNGRVAGVVFGKAAREGVGYALTSQEISDDLDTALKRTLPVDNSRCVSR